MIDQAAAHLALRNRASGLVVATTGTTSLSVTSSGIARTTGSFATDRFAVGMDVTPAGFGVAGNNHTALVTSVTPLLLGVQLFTVTPHPGNGNATVSYPSLTPEAAASGRSVIAGLPSRRAYELVDFQIAAGIPYLDEDFVPAGGRQYTGPLVGGDIEETGLYVLKWYGTSGAGITALRRSVDALKARYAPGTPITSGADEVRIRTDLIPFAGQVLPNQDGGLALLTLTIPWRAHSQNVLIA
jgi:hypothetical protein